MGSIPGLLGFGGGAGGTSFAGPGQANIQAGVNTGQVNQAYDQNQQAMQGQNALLAALQGQNGVGNQSQVYGQLQGIASGAVNPAQAQFNNNTAQNVANQSALMAGQRGGAANVGLLARQAGMQGAGIQQQAVGQQAAQQAQNQIGAIGQAGSLATQQAGQQIAQTNANVGSQQAEQSSLLNAIGQLNNANVASQGSVNSANAGLANTQMGGQQDLIGGALGSTGLAGFKASSQGGMLAVGGQVNQANIQNSPQSAFGQYLSGMSSGGMAPSNKMVDVVVSPGEKIVSPQEVQKVSQGGTPKMETVPGKPEVSGDSIKNDKVPARLPAGTVVVKRTRANNNPEGFIREVLSKRKGGK